MTIALIGRTLGLASKVGKGTKTWITKFPGRFQRGVKRAPGVAKGEWTALKTELKGVKKGLKKAPLKIGKTVWKYPYVAGTAIGVGGGLLLGEKRIRYGYGNKKNKKKKV